MYKTICVLGAAAILAVAVSESIGATSQRRSREAEALAEPFIGVTIDGEVIPGLFAIRPTGISTEPLGQAAERYLATLDDSARAQTLYDVDSDEWRRWNNIHRYDRRGLSRREMSDVQEAAALDLLRATLSAQGFAKARDVMILNGVLADLVDNHEEYGEGLYHVTVMGTPSTREPWGWQLDGHHLVINTFVLGDQVVMTPTFMGSEPVVAESGPHAGTRVFAPEESRGLALVQALRPEQLEVAIVAPELPRQVFTAAFRDNHRMGYEGILASALDAEQQRLLIELIREYVGNMRDGHAEVRMDEVVAHLDETRFAWMGAIDDDAVFYYRVHSPVILIEFDHQGGIALRADGPTRNHVHTVVRTPNGNDYGKDLLRQHHERFVHIDGEHHPRR